MQYYPVGHYVYAYLRGKASSIATQGTPYYIGKGTRYRAWDKNHAVGLPQKAHIRIVEENLTQLGAFALERFLIRWYGRIDVGTGILRNKSDGGEGLAVVSESTRKKMSVAKLGKKQSQATILKRIRSLQGRPGGMLGKKHTKQWSEMMSLRRRGSKGSNAKLKEEQVLEILSRLKKKDYTNMIKLGEEYGVTRMTISAINNHKIWKHLVDIS